MSIESVMPYNHLILCHPLLLLTSIFPSIRVFFSESVLRIRWPKYWSFSFSISPSSEYSGLISFRIDWLGLLAVQGALKSLLQGHSSKASILQHSAMAPHSSTLAWKVPWTEEPGGLQSMESLRVGHDWATSLSLLTFMLWRRKWQPTPVFLPGESQGWRSLVGGRLWGCTELDTTEWLGSSSSFYSYLFTCMGVLLTSYSVVKAENFLSEIKSKKRTPGNPGQLLKRVSHLNRVCVKIQPHTVVRIMRCVWKWLV